MKNLKLMTVVSVSLCISACSLTPEKNKEKEALKGFGVERSYLASEQKSLGEPSLPELSFPSESSSSPTNISRRLSTLPRYQQTFSQAVLSERFPKDASLVIAADEMQLKDFLHYVFGELLQINYILDESLKSSKLPVTLNVNEAISPARLFELTLELLAQKDITINFNEDVYYVHQATDKTQLNVIVAVGRDAASVPRTAQDILQVVPMLYGINISLERTLRELSSVKVTPDFQQNTLFLSGSRNEILKALDFVRMFDNPANRSSFISIIELTFLDTENFGAQISKLLETEGVPVGVSGANQKNVVLIPLEQLGSVAVFTSSETLLSRVEYWAAIIDKPGKGATEQYFTYKPKFARAADIGESLQNLFSGSTGASSVNSDNSSSVSNNTTGNAPNQQRSGGVNNERFKMVVDERSNSIIFYASGTEYQKVLPLIKELDILPKQVMLDITIAEVTLQDEFKFGVEWAIANNEVSLSTLGAFGISGIGGVALNIVGKEGPLNANAISTSSLVKVLSNPTILVRDGMTANINIGSTISVVGSTTTDPINSDRQTTSTEYRETGVDVTVTPTVNAQGILIMEIAQSISNTVPNSSGASGNPDIFERSLTTEVVANSGETILLGGLISEDISESDTGTPGVSKIPLLGKLFESKGDNKTRTELVMLITARVVENQEEWQDLGNSFKKGLNYLKLND